MLPFNSAKMSVYCQFNFVEWVRYWWVVPFQHIFAPNHHSIAHRCVSAEPFHFWFFRKVQIVPILSFLFPADSFHFWHFNTLKMAIDAQQIIELILCLILPVKNLINYLWAKSMGCGIFEGTTWARKPPCFLSKIHRVFFCFFQFYAFIGHRIFVQNWILSPSAPGHLHPRQLGLQCACADLHRSVVHFNFQFFAIFCQIFAGFP